MRIAIVIDKSRAEYLPGEEGRQEDRQSLKTMKSIKEVLSKEYDVIHLTVGNDLIDRLKEEKVDLVFNLSNGVRGEDNLLQLPALLELAGIPYTGSTPLAHGLAYNKIYSGKVFEAFNIKTPSFTSVANMEELKSNNYDYPVLIKPKDEGSSRGIHNDSLIFNFKSLKNKIQEQLKTYNPPIMVMEYIEGTELTVGIIEDGGVLKVLPVLEIDFSDLPKELNKIYSFEAKVEYADYISYHIPARVDDETRRSIEDTAKRAFRALGLRDYARVDIRLKDGIPYVIEINSLPGLQKDHSDLCKMAEAMNLTYDKLIKTIVKQGINRAK